MNMRFSRKDNALYSIPQRFADERLPFCPICGSDDPHWLTAEHQKLFYKYYYFKCGKCGSVFSATADDVSGLSGTTASFYGKYKKYKGKDNRTVYIHVDQTGAGITDIEKISLQNRELALEDLLHIGETLRKK